MIPQDWQPIGEPDVPELSADAQKVQAYLAEHGIDKLTKRQEMAMRIALRMGFDRLRDAVYEFRKWEAIMARKPKFNKEQRAEMLRLHNSERYSVGKLASKFGCSQTAVKTALQAAKIEAEDETMHNTGINAEFEQAVDQMIEEAKTPTEAVQDQPAELEPVIAAVPEKIPNYIWLALDDQCSAINLEIETRQERMAELRSEIEKLEEIKAGIYAWLDAHEVEGKA